MNKLKKIPAGSKFDIGEALHDGIGLSSFVSGRRTIVKPMAAYKATTPLNTRPSIHAGGA